MIVPRLTGHFLPRTNWPTWLPVSWSPTLFTRSGPDGIPPVPWTENAIEKMPFFVRRVGHCWRGDLVGRTAFWIFLSGLQKLGQRAKKCIKLRVEYVEKLLSVVAVACFHPGRAKGLALLLVIIYRSACYDIWRDFNVKQFCWGRTRILPKNVIVGNIKKNFFSM